MNIVKCPKSLLWLWQSSCTLLSPIWQVTIIASLIKLELIAFTLLLCSHLSSFRFILLKQLFGASSFMASSLGAILGAATHFPQGSCSSKFFHTIHCLLQNGLEMLLHATFPLSHYLKVVLSRYKLDNNTTKSAGTQWSVYTADCDSCVIVGLCGWAGSLQTYPYPLYIRSTDFGMSCFYLRLSQNIL